MPDIFDFISTRQEVNEPISQVTIPKLEQPNLLPNVPADNRTQNPNASLLDFVSQKVSSLPDNRPAYSYTNQQEKRYSNPNLQFTPYTTLGTDIEDIYARHQGAGTQLWNSLVKASATTVGTFASSFLSIPSTLDLIRSGKYMEAFEDDSLFSDVQNWVTGMEDKFPNYYSEWERDHPYMSAITPTGAANFWGDKVIKNIGFSIGALAAGLVQDAGIELLSGGAATPVTFLALANQIRKVPSNLFRGFRSLTKAAQTAEGINNVIGAAKAEKNLFKALSLPTLQQVGKASRFASISYLGAQGESFIEGYNAYLDTKKGLIQEAIDSGEKLTPELLSDIEQRAQNAGRWTTGLNLPLLTVSNMIEFPSLLYGKSAFGKTIPFLETQLSKEGLEITSNYTFKKGLKEWALEAFKDSLTEGGEEAGQYFISNSLHDYYADRLNPNIKGELFDYTLKNAHKVLNDPQIYQEAFLGALSGFLMGAPVTIPSLKNGKSRYDSLASNLNSAYQRFNSTVKQFSSTIELNNLEESEKPIAAHKNLYSLTHDSLKYGTYETFQDSLEDLKTVDLNSFNQTFGTEFKDQTEQVSFVNSLIKETEQIKSDVENTESFFPKNPYSKPFLLKKIQNAFTNKSQREIENIQENLFTDFKEVVGYNQSLQRVTKGQSQIFQNELKSLGVKDEAIGFLGTIANPKGLFQYSRWKKEQIDNLSDRLKYYDGLGQLDLKTKEEKEKVQKELKRLNTFYPVLSKLYERLKENPKDEEIKNLINALVLSEETSEEQRRQFRENQNKKLEELQKTEQQSEALAAEEKDLFSEESQTAEQLINLNHEAEQVAAPSENVPVPVPPTIEEKWLKEYNVGDTIYARNSPMEVVGKTQDSLLVKDEHGTYIVRKKGNKWEIEGQNSNLYHLGSIQNKTELEKLTEDVSEQFIPEEPPLFFEEIDFENSEPPRDIPVPETIPELTLGDEFTPGEVFKTNNTAWIRSKDSLKSANFVYTMENGWLLKRTFLNEKITDQVKGRWDSAEILPQYLDGTFKQVLRGDEEKVSIKNSKILDKDNNLKSFMGETYNHIELRTIFESKIQQGIFELNC